MKKSLIVSLFISVFVMHSWAFSTTITSSIYVDPSDTIYVNMPLQNIPTGANRIRFINNASSILPQLTKAMTTASLIFTRAMEMEYIDLVPIKAEISMGQASDFDQSEVCKVSVVYTDTIDYYTYLATVDQQYSDYSHPVLIPKALSDQTRGYCSGTSMYILMHPNVSYHCDTTECPSNKYDAITILLRAIAMGCGLQSTFNASTFHIGIVNGNTTYVNAFDTQIYNENNAQMVNVIDGDLSLFSFLNGKAVYARGLGHVTDGSITSARLFNGWENGVGSSLNHLTLNTISSQSYTVQEIENDFMDLMDSRIGKGNAVREVTPYTMALLSKIGWLNTTPIGNNPLIDLHECHLLCDDVLSPNTEYQISISSNMIDNFDNVVCELRSINNTYPIGIVDDDYVFSYSTIPNNIQWERHPVTKNIMGHIKGDAWLLSGGIMYHETKIKDIEIPYRPNKPLVQNSETAYGGKIHLSLSAYAGGSETYTVTYTGLTDGQSHTFTASAQALDTILLLSPTQYYDVAIYGTNSMGNSDTFYLTVGSSVPHSLNLTYTIHNSFLTYDLTDNGLIDPSVIFVTSTRIYNTFGQLEMTVRSKDWTRPINISSLPRGYHILTVVANGQTYSVMFFKF